MENPSHPYNRAKLYTTRVKEFPKSIPGLSLEDELNLYLVANGLKPASSIDLSNTFYEPHKARISDGDLIKFTNLLENLRVSYEVKDSYLWPEDNPRLHNIEIVIARNEKDLNKLRNAKSPEESGIALGYPKKAARIHNKKVDGIVRDARYYLVSRAAAEKAGKKLPTWAAYISHAPEKSDFSNEDVAKSSEALGKRYEHFVKANNPELARRVEAEFYSSGVPSEWKLDKDGKYLLKFKNRPNDWQ